MKKKILLPLSLLLAFSLLAACGAAEAPEQTAPPEPTPAVEEIVPEPAEPLPEEAPEAPLPEYVLAMSEKLDAYPPDTVVMTVDGREVTWDLYYYWITDLLSGYCSYSGALPEDFNEAYDEEETLDTLFRHYADSCCTYYMSLLAHAEELGAGLSEEDEAALQQARDATAANYGGEEAFLEVLRRNCISERAFLFYNSFPYLTRNLRAALYGEEGELLPQEEIDRYVAENGLVRAKHILLGTPEDPAESEDVQAQILGFWEELSALAGDPEALEARFDELAAEYSEDPGLSAYPDGYTFGSGEMVPEFENAAFALEDYGLSEVTATDYGWHILLRLPIDPDVVISYDNSSYQPNTLRSLVINQNLSEMTSQWSEEAEVEKSAEFEDFTMQDLFYPEGADAPAPEEGVPADGEEASVPENAAVA